MTKITGFKQKEDWTDGCLDRAIELYYLTHTSNVLSSTSAMDPSVSKCLPSTKSEDADAPCASHFHLYVSRSQVKRQLERLNWNKPAGPDRVSPRVLKAYAELLCGILCVAQVGGLRKADRLENIVFSLSK
ncbi:hypothetical protein GOODEAATRI_032734 [Goodea atripinnis]|uniref:Uncharacterized protein n=1 Tax=Goodea atripinnis TaxID=208336 RepID=A0ABV0PTK8_9TELE